MDWANDNNAESLFSTNNISDGLTINQEKGEMFFHSVGPFLVDSGH